MTFPGSTLSFREYLICLDVTGWLDGFGSRTDRVERQARTQGKAPAVQHYQNIELGILYYPILGSYMLP